MRDASLLIRSIGDSLLTVESSIGYSLGARTMWLPADESLWTPFQVVPEIRVRVTTSSDSSSFSGVRDESCLLLTSLSQQLIIGKEENKKAFRDFPNPQELVGSTLLPLHLVAH